MDNFTLLIFVLAPALLVGLCAYMVLRNMLAADNVRRDVELLISTRKITVPARLQAYERILLFLERISPDSLILRTHKPEMTAQMLHIALLSTVRSEFEHNISQQLYIGIDTWNMVKAAKESILTHINQSAADVSGNGSAIELARIIVETYVEKGKPDLILAAKEKIKLEAQKIF